MLGKGNLVKTNILFFIHTPEKHPFWPRMASFTSLFFHEIDQFQVLGDVEISYIGFGDDSKKILISISLFIIYETILSYNII